MHVLNLTENETQLTYTGFGDMDGVVITILKDSSKVDVHQITPSSKTDGQTWQAIRDQLAKHLA